MYVIKTEWHIILRRWYLSENLDVGTARTWEYERLVGYSRLLSVLLDHVTEQSIGKRSRSVAKSVRRDRRLVLAVRERKRVYEFTSEHDWQADEWDQEAQVRAGSSTDKDSGRPDVKDSSWRRVHFPWWPNGSLTCPESPLGRSLASASRLRDSCSRQQKHVDSWVSEVLGVLNWLSGRPLGSTAESCTLRQELDVRNARGTLQALERRIDASCALRVSTLICSGRKQCSTSTDLLLCRVTLTIEFADFAEPSAATLFVTEHDGGGKVRMVLNIRRYEWTVSPSRHLRIADSRCVTGVEDDSGQQVEHLSDWHWVRVVPDRQSASLASAGLSRRELRWCWCFPCWLKTGEPSSHRALHGVELETLLFSSRGDSGYFGSGRWKCRLGARSSSRAKCRAVSSDGSFCGQRCGHQRKSIITNCINTAKDRGIWTLLEENNTKNSVTRMRRNSHNRPARYVNGVNTNDEEIADIT